MFFNESKNTNLDIQKANKQMSQLSIKHVGLENEKLLHMKFRKSFLLFQYMFLHEWQHSGS